MRVQSAYTPQEHQARIHTSGSRYKLFLGGVGSGKSLTGLHEMVYAAQDNPLCDGLICAPTVPMFRDVIATAAADWLPPQCYTFKRSDQYIVWHPTGRRWFIRTATAPDRASGLNIGYGWFDEAALVRTDKLWKIMLARLRQKAQRPTMIVTTTPNGLNWLIKWFVEQQTRDPASVMIVRCKTSDNHKLPDDFEAGLRAAYGEELAQQMLDAMVLSLMGLAWPIVPSIHCTLSVAEMRDRSVLTFGGVDWGHTAPAALIVGGLDAEGRWYLRRLWYKRGQTRAQIAEQAAKLTREENVEAWFIDHDPEGERAMKEHDLTVFLAEKTVESGVQHVRSLLPVRKDGQPHLYVARELADWHREQSAYSFPEDKEEPEGPNGDHAMDATRYMTFSPTQLTPYQQSKIGLDRIGGFMRGGGFGGVVPH